jgi:hypothetical protein
MAVTPDPAYHLRRVLMVLLGVGLTYLALELVLLEHFENAWMILPLAAIAAALVSCGALVAGPTPLRIRMFRAVMASLTIIGLIGVVLHYRVGVEFQSDMDPTLGRGQMMWKVLHMKAPPMLAPGALAQLGLLGLIVVYRYPVRASRSS